MKKAIGGVVLIFIAGIAVKGVGVFPVVIVGIIAAAATWQIKDLRKCAEENRKLLENSTRSLGVIHPAYRSAEVLLKKIKEENVPAVWEGLDARFTRVDICYTESKLNEAGSLMEIGPVFLAHKAHRLLMEFVKEASQYISLFGEIQGFSEKMKSLTEEISKLLVLIEADIISMGETAGSLPEELRKEFMHAVHQFEKTKKLLTENKQIDRAAASARLREISGTLKKIEKGVYTLPQKRGMVIPLSKKTS